MAHIIYSSTLEQLYFIQKLKLRENMLFGADAGIDMNKKGYEIQIVM